ncbi:uncharacterized protein LOC132210740 [Stegostoma tigrinum]|uniref:uncharacterized protein LOC132210740 n=1 Tax=Stegostoma tigrinum TaxID=3053191 RepID=UPI00286FD06C|nr:uncharacterized protein LOC132210740 [Stegostoma tigrinum]
MIKKMGKGRAVVVYMDFCKTFGKPSPVKNIFNNLNGEAHTPLKHCEVSAVSSIHSFTHTSIEKMRYERPCESMVSTRPTSPLESESSIQLKSLPEPLQSPCLSVDVKSCKSKKIFQDRATTLLSPVRSAAKSTFNSDFSPIVSSVSMPEGTPSCLQSCEVNEKDEEVQQEFLTLNKNNNYTTMKKSCSSESSIMTARSSSNFTMRTISSKRTTAEETLSTSAVLEEGRRGMDKVLESEVHQSELTQHQSLLLAVFSQIKGNSHQSGGLIPVSQGQLLIPILGLEHSYSATMGVQMQDSVLIVEEKWNIRQSYFFPIVDWFTVE